MVDRLSTTATGASQWKKTQSYIPPSASPFSHTLPQQSEPITHAPRFCNPDAARRRERDQQARPRLSRQEGYQVRRRRALAALPIGPRSSQRSRGSSGQSGCQRQRDMQQDAGTRVHPGESFGQPHDISYLQDHQQPGPALLINGIADRQMHRLQQDEASKAQLRGRRRVPEPAASGPLPSTAGG